MDDDAILSPFTDRISTTSFVEVFPLMVNTISFEISGCQSPFFPMASKYFAMTSFVDELDILFLLFQRTFD